MEDTPGQWRPVGQSVEVSHKDLYIAIGELGGRIASMQELLRDKRADITALGDRLTTLETTRIVELEKKVAMGVIIAMVSSMILPIGISYSVAQYSNRFTDAETLQIKQMIETAIHPANRNPPTPMGK